jgi:hypothetical protein
MREERLVFIFANRNLSNLRLVNMLKILMYQFEI